MILKKYWVILFVLIVCLQNKNFAQYTEIGIGIGMANYWGDLNAPDLGTNVSNGGLTLQFTGRYIYKNYLGARVNLLFGKLSGDDSKSSLEWQKIRNLSFQSPLAEFSVMGEFYIFGYNTYEGSTVFSPYFTAGAAVFRFDPKTKYQGNLIRLQPLGTEGQGMPGFNERYSLISGAIAFGGGAKFKLSDKINISAELIGRRTFTDYLDDISDTYVNYDDLSQGNGVLAANLGNRMAEFLGQTDPVQLPTGSQRGGAKVKDYYFISTISINIKIGSQGFGGFGKGNKIKCPTFK